jgi:hypothetical protein
MRLRALSCVVHRVASSCEAMPDSDRWPFEDPANTAVFSTKSVTSGSEPILRVSHDADDGAWQFFGEQSPTEESASVVALSTVVRLDGSVVELADLPLGWIAWRDSAGGAWRRSKAE